MPRSKSRAQRLAPPLQFSESQLDQYAAGVPETSYATPSCPQPKTSQTVKTLRKGSSFEERNHQKSTKKRRQSPGTMQFPLPGPEQSRTIAPSGPFFSSRTNVVECREGCTRTASDLDEPRPSRLSCSSSDTASIGLAEHIPQPAGLERMPHVPFEKNDIPNSYKNNNRQKFKRTPDGRFASNSFKRKPPFPAALSDRSSVVKKVDADPIPPTIPPALCGVPLSSQGENAARNERHKFSFLPDDEAKSVFGHRFGNHNSEKAGLSQREADKERLRNYWEEVETMSIRRSSQAQKNAEKRRHNRVKQMANHAPSLYPNSQKSALEVTNAANPTAHFNHGKMVDIAKDSQMPETLHPITEENLDGGDAMPLNKQRKRKSLKKGKSSSALSGSSSGKETQGHALEQRVNKETKRKKSYSSSWVGHMKNSSVSREGVEPGLETRRVPSDGARTTAGRGELHENDADTASSTGFSESDGQSCMECGRHGKASKMVLCDACSDGCHTFCMRPARTSVPLGVWICPRCHVVAKKHEIHLSQLSEFVESHGFQGEKACIS